MYIHREEWREIYRDILEVWRCEVYDIMHDQGLLVLFFLVPLIYPPLYAYIYNGETVHDTPLIVADESDGSLSREYIRRIDGTSLVNVTHVTPTMSEALRLFRQREGYGILHLPRDFDIRIKEGKACQVSLYTDISIMLHYKNFLIAANEQSFEMGADIRLKKLSGTQESSLNKVRPVRHNEIALFNPAAGYATFLLPLVLLMILQQTMLIGVGMLAGTKRERNIRHRLISNIHGGLYNGSIRVVVGKSLAYLPLYFAHSLWGLLLIPALFHLPLPASPVTGILFIAAFITSCTFFSLTIGSIIRNREHAFIILVFTSVLFMFLSGVIWPEGSMPTLWRRSAYLIPTTPGSRGWVSLTTMGGGLDTILTPYLTLWIQSAVYFITSCLCYEYQLRRSHLIPTGRG